MDPSSTLPPLRLLIINPNTSKHMTTALLPVISSLSLSTHLETTPFTSPDSSTAIPSINSPADASASADICLPALLPLLPHHDAFLIACYSVHPLVPALKDECISLSAAATQGSSGSGARKYVTGIFEASVLASLSMIRPGQKFGIVSTGKVWEEALRTGVEEFLGSGKRFAGCETTGLNASELHELPAAEVRGKMMDATKRLFKAGNVGAVCLGCAGMVGLEEAVRTACVEELGEEKGKAVHIVDGVKAGVTMLFGEARCGF